MALLFDGPEWHQIHMGFDSHDFGEFQNSGRERWLQGSASGNCARERELDVRPWQSCSQMVPIPWSFGESLLGRSNHYGHSESRGSTTNPSHSGKLRGLCGTDQSSSGASAGPGTTTCGSGWAGRGSSRDWTSSREGFHGIAETCGGGQLFEERDRGGKVQEEERQEKKEQRQKAKLFLEQLLQFQPKFEQQQLCEMEDEWQKPKSVSSEHGEGGHQEVQKEIRLVDLCGEASGSTHRQLHQCPEAETDERRNCPYQPAERHRDDGVCHDRGRRLEGGEGSARSTHHIAVDGLHQPRRSGEGDGRFVHAHHRSPRSKSFGRNMGQGCKEGADSRGVSRTGSCRADWSGLIGPWSWRGREILKTIPPKAPFQACVDILSEYVAVTRGSLNHSLRGGLGNRTSLEAGVSPSAVFPLPLMSPCKLPRRGRSRERAKARNSFLNYVNLIISALNHMYSGCSRVSRVEPTLAQARVHQCIFTTVSSFLRSGVRTSGEEEIKDYLLESMHYNGAGGRAQPLGLRAGVPDHAAVVDLKGVLDRYDKGLAEQVEHPSSLLYPKRLRPKHIPKPFCKLHETYPAYVKRNVKAGLQTLLPRKSIYKIKGRPLYSGAFAVPKNSDEDRAISALCPLNALVNPAKLWKPRFAIMPMMRALQIAPGKRLRIYKKDARHFFHFLRIGRRWRKYMAHPPLKATAEYPEMFPAHAGVPMGFTAAASWAQAYNEAKAVSVSLPSHSRLVDSQPPPSVFPIWGSILDDIWAIEECDSTDDPPGVAHRWMQDMAHAWKEDGVVEHEKKAVTGVYKEEVQGVLVEGSRGWLGVSREKRAQLFQAGMYLLAQRRPLVGEVDRWLGKLSFALSFRPCARSILQDIYVWLGRHRGICKRAELWPSVRAEIVMSLLFIPFMQSDLRSSWCRRVEASDAAPGGHGRAWTQMSEPMVAEAARLCSHKGVYTNLESEFGIILNDKGECPMQQVSLPLHQYKWSTAARQGGYKHITIEEAIALNWSLHDRLKRPSELGQRVLHLVDSAAAAGAYKKGRSASRKLNGCCRQACAIICASGIDPYFVWVPTDVNPADEPSSRHGVRADQHRTVQPKPHQVVKCGDTKLLAAETNPFHTPCDPGFPKGGKDWRADEDEWLRALVISGLAQTSNTCYQTQLPEIFIHLCSGPRRVGDVCDWIIRQANLDSRAVLALRVDPLISRSLDLVDGMFVCKIEGLICSGRCLGVLASPPCSTWSRARHVPLTGTSTFGPRPLRSRADPWVCLDGRSRAEQALCNLGSCIMLACVYLLGLAHYCWRGLEHPKDPGSEPFPSFLATKASTLLQAQGMKTIRFDQCRFGANARKPTQMLISQSDLVGRLGGHFCNHTCHTPHIGKNKAGGFMTTPLAAYHSHFCLELATLAGRCPRGFFEPRRHEQWRATFAAAAFPFEHPTKQVSSALPKCSWSFQG